MGRDGYAASRERISLEIEWRDVDVVKMLVYGWQRSTRKRAGERLMSQKLDLGINVSIQGPFLENSAA
jgi:hypothetical protein